MPAQNLRLSDRQLKGVKPASKDYVLTDGDGLQLRVRSNGSLLWNFNYREPVTKKRINIGFGTYPELSLANARKKAVEARELLAQGIDPKVQRNTLNEAKRAETEHTFENVATAWFELKKDSVTPGLRRGHLAVAHTARIPRFEDDTTCEDHRADGDRIASSNRSERQPGDGQASQPATKRNHDLRRELRPDLRQPA